MLCLSYEDNTCYAFAIQSQSLVNQINVTLLIVDIIGDISDWSLLMVYSVI